MIKTLLGYRIICEECGDKSNTWVLNPEAKVTQKKSFEEIDAQITQKQHAGHRYVKREFRARTIEGLWKKMDRAEKSMREELNG